MTTSPTGRANELQFNGDAIVIPGLSGRTLDKVPFHFANADEISFSTSAAASAGLGPAPCAMEIAAIAVHLRVAPGATDETLNVGTAANNDAFIEDYVLPNSTGTVLIPLATTETSYVTNLVAQGDHLTVDVPAAAANTGRLSVSVICVPRQG